MDPEKMAERFSRAVRGGAHILMTRKTFDVLVKHSADVPGVIDVPTLGGNQVMISDHLLDGHLYTIPKEFGLNG